MSDQPIHAGNKGYKGPPPSPVSVCGIMQFPDSRASWCCALQAGHTGDHVDFDGERFSRGYVKNAAGSYVQEAESLPALTPESGPVEVVAVVVPVDDGGENWAPWPAVNDYKQDVGKPPLMEAVLIPFGKTLLDLAAMMEDMKHKHKLAGAADPFQEWRKLPGGKWRWANGGARHATTPYEVNTEDGTHLHILHAIWGLMASYELHLQELNQQPKE